MVPEQLALQFRERHGKVGAGGVIVVFNGEACSWVDKLRNPEDWRHGAIAVDEFGAKWKAVGSWAAQSGKPGADDTAIAWVGLDVLAPKRGPGRPSSGKALDGKARQAAYRARRKEEGKEELKLFVPKEVADALRGLVERKNADTAVDLVTMGDVAAAILKDRLLRKR